MVYNHIFLHCNSNLLPKCMFFQNVPFYHMLHSAQYSFRGNDVQSESFVPVLGSRVNCQLTKDWKECVLGLVCGGFSQQESSGVFLFMGHNGFSPPMKHYSGWQAGLLAT